VWIISIDRALNTLHFFRFKNLLKDPDLEIAIVSSTYGDPDVI
jgi:hypothetical protein